MSIPTITLRELEIIGKRMRQFDKKANKKILLPAIRKGIIPIKRQAKRNAPWKSIRKLIASKAFVARSKNVIGKVFVRKSKDRTIKLEGRTVGFEVAANILEFGRKKGDLKPRPFMRTAREEKKFEAMRIVKQEVAKRIKEVVAGRIKI